MTVVSKKVRARKVLVAMPLALFLIPFNNSYARLACGSDGLEVKFLQETAGSVEIVKSLSPEDIVGGNWRGVQKPALKSDRRHRANYRNGKLKVDSLDSLSAANYGFKFSGFNHLKRNAWEVEFPRGMYEFDRKEDLVIEVIVAVSKGQASHITDSGSSVSLVVEEGSVYESWWSGTNSLRMLRGDLMFSYSDFVALMADGVHRASLELCVNVRGNR